MKLKINKKLIQKVQEQKIKIKRIKSKIKIPIIKRVK
jgi:hypothetical protein